jgi:two-component system, OmpR family, response regulator
LSRRIPGTAFAVKRSVTVASSTILVVDDDPEVIHTFRQWLELEGYQVRTASDGQTALPLTPGVDAIILDARMPVLDGLGFLRRLREQGVQVPVAIVTGDYLIEESMLAEFQDLGARVMFKPVWVDELGALTACLVARSEAS